MGKPAEIRSKMPCIGQYDTEAYNVPLTAFNTCRGFDLRRGFPFTESARAVYTTAEIRTSKRVRELLRWTSPGAGTAVYAICDGGLWEINGPTSFTLLSTVDPGGTATLSSTTVTISSVPNGTLVGVVRVGDEFYYDADGIDAGGTVTAVAAGSLTLDAYAGSATSGAFTIWRRLTDQESYMVAAGGRLFLSDGSGPLHEYGPEEAGSGTYAFRQTGVPEPALQPILALGSGGSLTAGDYSYYVSFESKRGEVGNPVLTRTVTASATQKTTMTAMPAAPESPRGDRYRIYRTKAGSTAGWYHLTQDVWDKATGVAGQVVTISTGGLTADAHIYRRLKFITSGNSYEITDNAAGTVTVSGVISGESSTDDVQIYGGYSISAIQAASATFVDYSSDDDLDVLNEAPVRNAEPPSGLKHLVAFQGGGRIGGFVKSLFYCSGRPPTTSFQGIADGVTHGLGEFGYWVDEARAFDVGQEDGDDVQGAFVLGTVTYAAKDSSVWYFHAVSHDMDDFQWFSTGQNVGMIAPKSLAVSDAAYWLGTVGQEVDVIRFDGQFARGLLRGRLRATMDGIRSFTEATGVIFQSRYYLSYDSDGGGTNDRTLRYDLATRGVEEQAWGCGVFMNPFMSTATPTLYCGAPTNLGSIYNVEATAQDLGSDTTRLLETGDIHLPESEYEGFWTYLQLELVVE